MRPASQDTCISSHTELYRYRHQINRVGFNTDGVLPGKYNEGRRVRK